MEDSDQRVYNSLIPIFPQLSPKVIRCSILDPSNRMAPFEVPLGEDLLLQRCIDDLLDLRTYRQSTLGVVVSDDSSDSASDSDVQYEDDRLDDQDLNASNSVVEIPSLSQTSSNSTDDVGRLSSRTPSSKNTSFNSSYKEIPGKPGYWTRVEPAAPTPAVFAPAPREKPVPAPHHSKKRRRPSDTDAANNMTAMKTSTPQAERNADANNAFRRYRNSVPETSPIEKAVKAPSRVDQKVAGTQDNTVKHGHQKTHAAAATTVVQAPGTPLNGAGASRVSSSANKTLPAPLPANSSKSGSGAFYGGVPAASGRLKTPAALGTNAVTSNSSQGVSGAVQRGAVRGTNAVTDQRDAVRGTNAVTDQRGAVRGTNAVTDQRGAVRGTNAVTDQRDAVRGTNAVTDQRGAVRGTNAVTDQRGAVRGTNAVTDQRGAVRGTNAVTDQRGAVRGTNAVTDQRGAVRGTNAEGQVGKVTAALGAVHQTHTPPRSVPKKETKPNLKSEVDVPTPVPASIPSASTANHLEDEAVKTVLDMIPDAERRYVRDLVNLYGTSPNGINAVLSSLLEDPNYPREQTPPPPRPPIAAARTATSATAAAPAQTQPEVVTLTTPPAPAPPVPQQASTADALEDAVNQVAMLFADIDKDFVRTSLGTNNPTPELINGVCMRLLEQKDYPKIKATSTPVAKVASPPRAEVLKDYYTDYSDPVHHCAREQTVNLLTNDFRRVSVTGIRSIAQLFNYHYAPARKCIMEALQEHGVQLDTVGNVSDSSLSNSLEGEFSATPLEQLSMRVSTGLQFINVFVPYKDTKVAVKMSILKSVRAKRSVWPLHEDVKKEIVFILQTSVEEKKALDHKLAVTLNEKEYEQEGQMIECGCCYGEVAFEDMIQCYEGHLFCEECLRNYTKEAVFGAGKATLACMTDGCVATFPISQLQKALPSETLSKYEDRVQEEAINMADLADLVRCPHCDFAAVLDPGDKVFRCQVAECRKETCRFCKEDWSEHFGIPCSELEKKDETKIRLAFEEKMTQAKIRSCPRCKASFTKSEGCNKMTCRCGAKMCYICRQPNIDYNHFCRHLREPGKSCTTCKACSLWTNPDEDDERAIKEIKAEAQEARQKEGYTDDKMIGASPEKTQPNPAKRPRLN